MWWNAVRKEGKNARRFINRPVASCRSKERNGRRRFSSCLDSDKGAGGGDKLVTARRDPGIRANQSAFVRNVVFLALGKKKKKRAAKILSL